MDPADGYICFRNSQLVSGRLGKVTLGGGNKSGLFQVGGKAGERAAGLAGGGSGSSLQGTAAARQ